MIFIHWKILKSYEFLIAELQKLSFVPVNSKH